MYESPIKTQEQHINNNVIQVLNDFRHDKDEIICKAIVRLGIYVNKEELIKALQYDRQQYQKGYEDAVKAFAKILIDKAEHIATWSDGELAITISEIKDTAKELVGDE